MIAQSERPIVNWKVARQGWVQFPHTASSSRKGLCGEGAGTSFTHDRRTFIPAQEGDMSNETVIEGWGGLTVSGDGGGGS